MTVAVLICTFGDVSTWNRFAERALESVKKQTRQPDAVIRYHGATLEESRNHAAAIAGTDAIIFLDADDVLDVRYVEAMIAGAGDLRYPRVQRINDATGEPLDDYPREYPKRPAITDGNYLVVASLMPRAAFLEVGGFRSMPAYEDWDLFCRLILWKRLEPKCCREAIYYHRIRPGSRNQISPEEQARLVRELRRAYHTARSAVTSSDRL